MRQHRLGYCIENTRLNYSTNKTCTARHVSDGRIAGLIEQNLEALHAILNWNRRHHIPLFRLGSGFIPFGAHGVENGFDWRSTFSEQLAEIGQLAYQHQHRLSMHAGYHGNLNSSMPCVVQAAMDEVLYHTTLMGSMGLDTSCKTVLHIGGLYENNKTLSIDRFIQAFELLPGAVKRRVVLENDNLFTVWDVLEVHAETQIPVVFNKLSHDVNQSSSQTGKSVVEMLEKCLTTWQTDRDGVPMVHFATQQPGGRSGEIAESIDLSDFRAFYHQTADLTFDLTLECWDREQSVLKAQETFGSNPLPRRSA